MLIVTLERGQVVFNDAKAYTNERLCRILMFQGNQGEYAIGNTRLVKCNKRQGICPGALPRVQVVSSGDFGEGQSTPLAR